MNITEGKEYLCQWARLLAEDGTVPKAGGIMSCRAGDKMIITTAGMDLAAAVPENLVVVDIAAGTLEEGTSLPEAASLHAAIYGKKTKFSVLIHTEQPNIMTSSRAGKTVYPMLDDLAQIAGATVRVADYSVPTDRKTIRSVLGALKRRSGALLKNHGAICGAGNFDDAQAVAQVMEKGCKTFIETSFLGGGVKINALECNLMRFVYVLKYSKADETNR